MLRPSRAYSSLLCDALHRASSDAERPRHLQDAHALRKLPSYLSFSRLVYLRPAELYRLVEKDFTGLFEAWMAGAALPAVAFAPLVQLQQQGEEVNQVE